MLVLSSSQFDPFQTFVLKRLLDVTDLFFVIEGSIDCSC